MVLDSARTRRAKSMAPIATNGTTASITSVSFQLVHSRIDTLPKACTKKRSAIEMFTVTPLWMTFVSAESRFSSSPVRCASKKPISCAMIRL